MKKSQSSDYINGLEKTLGIDKDGNLTAGKNLGVDGTIKLNGGIEPIHPYPLGNYTVEVLFERHVDLTTDYTFFGFIIYDDGASVPCMGSYAIAGGVLETFSAISYDTIFDWTKGGAVEEKLIATKP